MTGTRYARRYLASRGLSKAILLQAEVGYGDSFWSSCPPAFKFPIRDEDGKLVGYKERFWPRLWLARGDLKARKSRTLAGDGQSWLYPLWALSDSSRLIVVCEGEFDALLLNQHGLAAVTSTAGTSWKPGWNRWLEGCHVAVLYDAGSIELARRRAAEFRSAEARDAWAVRWPLCFADGEDAGDWFVKYRRSAEELRELMRDERRRSS